MSKVVKRIEERDLCHIVKVDNQHYNIDTVDNVDGGYDTAVFKCDERGEIENWAYSVYVEYHIDEASMTDRHKYICEHLEEYL